MASGQEVKILCKKAMSKIMHHSPKATRRHKQEMCSLLCYVAEPYSGRCQKWRHFKLGLREKQEREVWSQRDPRVLNVARTVSRLRPRSACGRWATEQEFQRLSLHPPAASAGEELSAHCKAFLEIFISVSKGKLKAFTCHYKMSSSYELSELFWAEITEKMVKAKITSNLQCLKQI